MVAGGDKSLDIIPVSGIIGGGADVAEKKMRLGSSQLMLVSVGELYYGKT